MAVTQQLCRTSAEILGDAASSLEALRSIVSFEYSTPPYEVLDLDWAPAMLTSALRASGEPALAAAVEAACKGSEIVNPRFPEGWGGDVYSEIRVNSAALVEALSLSLDGLSGDRFVGVGALLPDLIVDFGSVHVFERHLGKHTEELK